MKKIIQIGPLLFLFACGISLKEKSFISGDISITHKFYFISAENFIDRGRPISLVCSTSDSVFVFPYFETIGFDSVDYLDGDGSISIHNRLDSAIYFPTHKLDSVCDQRICVQLKSDFKIVDKIKLRLKEINSDKRLSSLHSNCEHMDEGLLYELETTEGDKYSIYDLILFEKCNYFHRDILLFKGSQLINEQHY
jgi:hypothetical protein